METSQNICVLLDSCEDYYSVLLLYCLINHQQQKISPSHSNFKQYNRTHISKCISQGRNKQSSRFGVLSKYFSRVADVDTVSWQSVDKNIYSIVQQQSKTSHECDKCKKRLQKISDFWRADSARWLQHDG